MKAPLPTSCMQFYYNFSLLFNCNFSFSSLLAKLLLCWISLVLALFKKRLVKNSYYLKLWNLINFVTIKSFTDNKEKKTKTMKFIFVQPSCCFERIYMYYIK